MGYSGRHWPTHNDRIYQRHIFTPLFLGAKIVIPAADIITYELLVEYLKEHGVTGTHLIPAIARS